MPGGFTITATPAYQEVKGAGSNVCQVTVTSVDEYCGDVSTWLLPRTPDWDPRATYYRQLWLLTLEEQRRLRSPATTTLC